MRGAEYEYEYRDAEYEYEYEEERGEVVRLRGGLSRANRL